ncbi:MAG TPA: dynamin family protein [Vicinamibacterales bacterium]|nr:dynamin family protein [Vicinamibacterales bacterium]
MLTKILTPELEDALRDERRVLARLRTALARFDAAPEQQAALDHSIQQLDELFLLVVVGEFNSGKSAFINALIGHAVLEEGVTPTTAEIQLLRFGDAVSRSVSPGGIHVITAPVGLLEDIHIVDTPGTNAVIREHERITTDFVPRADLVLFVTSADRPFTETERAFLEHIRGWGKKIVVVINKIDILDGDAEVQQVRRFVADSAQSLLGFTPEILPVSARLARRAREGQPDARPGSGFDALESYVRSTLDAPARLQLKLLNPLGVGAAVASTHLSVAQDRLSLLSDDFRMLDEVDRQLGVYEQDIARQLELRMSDIDRILLEMERRGHDYFDETLRLGRVFDLLNRSRVQEGFEQQVVADAPEQIERRIGELVDWLVAADLQQWQAVTSHLAERRQQYRSRILGGEEPGTFHYDRTRLIDAVGREAQRVVDSYDRRGEARALADGARNAVAAAAAAGAGALGLGAVVAAAATTAAADVTGLVMASVLAALGFFILPAKRQRTKQEMRRKISEVRERLSSALREQFSREIARSAERIRESIAPYSRFVRAEGDRLRQIEQELREVAGALQALRARIERRAA